MSIVGFKAQNHRQQLAKRGALDTVDDRRTPAAIFDPLHEEFGFTLDVAASIENAKCERFFTKTDDGLAQSWAEEIVWCNPPFSACGAWVEKAWEEDLATVVMILPGNRTEQSWWQELVEPHRDNGGLLTTRFIAGRPRFDVPEGTYSDPRGNRPPFGCVLLVWDRRRAEG